MNKFGLFNVEKRFISANRQKMAARRSTISYSSNSWWVEREMMSLNCSRAASQCRESGRNADAERLVEFYAASAC